MDITKHKKFEANSITLHDITLIYKLMYFNKCLNIIFIHIYYVIEAAK